MSTKAIREFDGKLLLFHHLLTAPSAAVTPTPAFPANLLPPVRVAQIQVELTTPVADNDAPDAPGINQAALRQQLDDLESRYAWLRTEKLVAKPDQLIKRRGKGGLLLLNADWSTVRAWIEEKAGHPVTVDGVTGILRTFIVEPFVPHTDEEEHYICIQSTRQGDRILFTHAGGVDVGDVDAKALTLDIPVGKLLPDADTIRSVLLKDIASEKAQLALAAFIERAYAVYVDLHFAYLEINPLVVTATSPDGDLGVYFLDMAAKLDQTAEFEAGPKWSAARKDVVLASGTSAVSLDDGAPMIFPAPFGRELTAEEAYIAELDAKTGASLKLTVLNRKGRIWTMVAGGGASVVYSDAIAALGFADELANYGEYSGAPSETQTYDYAKTILDLMTRDDTRRGEGKILFIGGGIANFTNVRVFVRRAGPNYQEGLRAMRQLGKELGVEIRVFGPETHITAIVPMALKPQAAPLLRPTAASLLAGNSQAGTPLDGMTPRAGSPDFVDPSTVVEQSRELAHFPTQDGEGGNATGTLTDTTNQSEEPSSVSPFSSHTRAIVYGMQPRAVQGMLDFDFICNRTIPSVACMVYPFGSGHMQKFYWGTQETLIPVYKTVKEAFEKHPDADTIVNFASCRSVRASTLELLSINNEHGQPQVRSVAIIAEGVPERHTRELLTVAQERGVLMIGPATVGGIKPGCFKIGNTGGMMDNIVASKLYRAGSVGYVSKSGGMSNELNNILSRCTDGVYEGVAIGGDRYPGSTFIDHLIRYEQDPNCKMMLLLGEVGGDEEYRVAEAVRSGQIKKPVVAWCIGTCAKMFQTEVQFGHAGALANSDRETADAKNNALKAAGVIVPSTFEELPTVLSTVYQRLIAEGVIVPRSEPEPPKIPIDYAWAQELGLVRKPAAFVSTICDDRGEELLYAGMRISDVFRQDIGIGGVLSLLWFKRLLPPYACRFIEMVLMLTADHGPAVSGAHNTIVTARAGKDLVSSLVAGLLTIGDRFGGALDGAADQFSNAYDQNMTPRQFVDTMRRQNRLILGIGHKIKSRTNPDLRVKIICDFARANFPATPILNFALAVEQITTAKKDNLILNVDGAIGVLFVDILRHCGAFTREEADEYVRIGTLNGLFVLGRSIGFIGHYLDQKRLKQGLYRHPWDDISYLMPGQENARVFMGAGSVRAAQR
ncbi:citrate synthase-like protein [Syncephalis plumigaleata]|nr:citrate synthase-like protein [Syncephalis plumigaleata]